MTWLLLVVLVVGGVVLWRATKPDEYEDVAEPGGPAGGRASHRPAPDVEIGRSSRAVPKVRRRLAEELGSLPKVKVREGPDGLLFVDQSYWAWWRWVIVVLVFPIGLLALVSSDSRTAVVRAKRSGDGTRVLVRGRLTPQAERAVERALWTTPSRVAQKTGSSPGPDRSASRRTKPPSPEPKRPRVRQPRLLAGPEDPFRPEPRRRP